MKNDLENKDLNETNQQEKIRIKNILESFNEKNEIFKKERKKTNSEKIKEEFKRLSELATGEKTSAIKENTQGGYMGGSHGIGQGRTVNSILDNFYENQIQYQGAKGNLVSLKDEEALDLSIKRTLNSGAPVNNISFYDEVNWQLAQLGFPSRLPQDIKASINKLIK